MWIAVAVSATLPAQTLEVRGRVVRQGASGVDIVPRALVTLHRIGDTSGPVDSMVTNLRGEYLFRVSQPDTSAMYLATSKYGGIAYFAPPVHPDHEEGPGEIVLFDTSSTGGRLQIVGRHLVVSAPMASGAREIVEVLEIENDAVVTRTGAPGRPSFVLALPGDAANIRSTQGDFAGNAVRVASSRVEVLAPIPPGVRQLAVTYQLPASAFPFSLQLADSAALLEVLLEEAGAMVRGGGVKSLGAVTSDGRTFTRYQVNGVPAGERLVIEVPSTASPRAQWLVIGGLLVASMGAAWWAVAHRRGTEPAAARVPRVMTRVELESAIAGVEATLADPATSPAALDGLRGYRDQLRRDHDRLVASHQPPP